MNENEKLIQTIIEAIQEKKGRNIVHVDLTGIETAAAQAFVIATGSTPMQVAAVADSVREYVEKNAGQRPFNYDGYENSQWIIIDYVKGANIAGFMKVAQAMLEQGVI